MIRSADAATASFVLPAADREFLRQNLSRLPGNEDYSSPATVDLNGKVAVRAKAADSDGITELVLRGATRIGEQVRFHTNRVYLARAMQLGFCRVHIISPNAPAYCLDEKRHYLWALLEPSDALKPTPDALQIESPQTSEVAGKSDHPIQRSQLMVTNRVDNGVARRKRLMTPTNSAAFQDAATSPMAESAVCAESSAIDQAMALRDSLRSIAGEVGELVRTLKREKKQHRAVRSTLLSLRQLQAIDG
jgi:hypothetical protein